MSLLPTIYKILSNILLSVLIPFVDETVGNYVCGFRHNSSDILHWSDIGEMGQYSNCLSISVKPMAWLWEKCWTAFSF